MSNWKIELENKAKELQLKKEEGEHVHTRIDSRISDRSSSRRRGNVDLPDIHKEINNVKEKGGNRMITLEAVLSDLEKIEKDDNMSEQKKLFAVVKVIMKFLSTMRSNQLLTEEEKKKIATEKATRKAKEEQK
jgi:hypothetical protein